MSDKYDIRHNPQEPTSESILKRKDFGALLREYDRTASVPPATRIRRIRLTYRFAVAASVAMVLAISGLIWQKMQEAPMTDLASFRPLPQVPQPAARFAVNNAKGDTIFQSSGSRIIIPPTAFVHADGKPVSGEVQLDFKEYQDKTEMFLSGLPMQTADGTPLESAGMMEIQGFQNGKPVFIDKNKQLDVEILAQIPNQTPTNDVNLYSFSPAKNAWIYSGADDLRVLSDVTDGDTTPTVQGNPSPSDALSVRVREKYEKQFPRPMSPVEPKRLNPNRFNFTLDVLPEQFPELAAQKDLIWEVSPESVFKEQWYDVNWTNIELKHLPGENRYEAQLKNGDSLTVRTVVYPVVKESDYRLALETYSQQLAAYKNALKQRETAIQEAIVSNAPQINVPAKSMVEEPLKPIKLILNHFTVNSFGAWACMRLAKLPTGGNPLPVLSDESGNPLQYDWIYVTNDQQNTLFRYAKGDVVNIDANKSTTIWAVTPDKRLIACKLDEQGVPRPRPEAMVSNEEDVRRVLGI